MIATGTLLAVAAALPLATAQQLTVLPDVPGNIPERMFDIGFPNNIPRDLPTQVPPRTWEPFNTSSTAGCLASVRSVLAANNRNILLALLDADPMGKQLLDGSAAATILAPTDSAMARLPPSQAALTADPDVARTYARYHVVKGVQVLDEDTPLGSWWYTPLQQAYCRTAFSTVTVLEDPNALGADPGFLIKSGASTARVTRANIPACSSVVHLLDSALQPCCSSLYELLPQFSVVKLQPSYFDGFKPIPSPGNTDADNRRIFEDAMVELLLVSRLVTRGAVAEQQQLTPGGKQSSSRPLLLQHKQQSIRGGSRGCVLASMLTRRPRCGGRRCG